MNKKYGLLGLILNTITLGIFSCFIANKLKLYKKDEWYSDYRYWVFATLCLVFPVFIMFIVFIIETNCKVANKLKVKGNKIYNTPYTWILFFIVPIVGWILFVVLYIYIITIQNVKLYNSKEFKCLK